MQRKLIFSQLLILLLAVTAVVPAQQPNKPTKAELELREHVQYLASDELAGRRTGEQGATYAAGYISNMFAAAKLKPPAMRANERPSFLHRFDYIAGVEVTEKTKLETSSDSARYALRVEKRSDFAPVANSINGTIPSSQIIFAGFGIRTADAKYDDYAGIDASGKVAIAFDGLPAGAHPHSPFANMNIHAKANVAKERGVRALLLISRVETFANDPLSRVTYQPTIGETAIPVVLISRNLAAELLGLQDISELADVEKWAGMRSDAPESIRIRLAKPPATKAAVTVDLEKKIVDAYNVIGVIEGRDKQLKDEAIIIGAHYDHLGRGGRSSLSPNSDDIHHGADDNASGTAALLKLAREFAREKDNERTIIFIAFGGEEEGLLGSKHYVDNPIWPLEKTVAMLNMDMVGRLNENKLTVGGIGTAAEMKQIVESVNSKLDSDDDESETGPFALQLNDDGFGPSDHSSFYGKEIPVLFFFTGTHVDYHKPTDTAEKINYRGLSRISDYVAEIVRTIDRNPKRPAYAVAKSSGMGGRTSFSVSLGTIPSYAETGEGLKLDGVRDGSPAAKAGLKGGDTIIKLAGKDVRNISDYMFAMSTMKAGEEYQVVVKRGTETVELKIVPAPAARR